MSVLRFFLKKISTVNVKSINILTLLFVLFSVSTIAGETQQLIFNTLSTKPNRVSGGDVLIQLELPVGINANAIVITLNDKVVTSDFRLQPNKLQPNNPQTYKHSLVGLLTTLKLGKNTLKVKSKNNKKETSASITLINYPITGPLMSGPHLSPFICQTNAFKLPDGSTLGAPLDKHCSIKPRIDYVYFSKTKNIFIPFILDEPLPEDVAMTVTSAGLEQRFIVRLETRTINRGIYQSTVLHDPTIEQPPSAFGPPKAWNKRLIAVHGFGCPRGWYRQGEVQGVSPLDVKRLGEGYALFTNTLNHPTNNCNPVLAGEATMMGKEHFIETMGVPDFTVSIGSSGGAYTSLQIADALPGLFDGVLIGSTFPDALSIALSGMDAHLLANYYLNNNSGDFSESQIVAVSGYKNARAWYDIALQSARTDPISNRKVTIPAGNILKGYLSGWWAKGMPDDIRFSLDKNLHGARATIFDHAKNIYGVDSKTGYANRPFDNIGVQYGLQALNENVITVQQFLNLNTQIGGFDHNANTVPARSLANSETLKRTYQSGISLSGGGGLANIPVFDLSHLYDEGELYHYQWFHFAVRERMRAHNGHSDNHVMWRGGGSAVDYLGSRPSAKFVSLNEAVVSRSWQTFIEWVAAYKADKNKGAQLEKVIRNKPAAAIDGCFSASLTPQFFAEPQRFSQQPDSTCNKQWPSYSFVRKEAGGPLHANTLKCALKPLERSDYVVMFTDKQWAQLGAIFTTGVCDWSQAGVESTPVVPWMTH